MPLSLIEKKKMRARVKRYERNFRKPPRPWFDDGGGTRFLIGPIYLLIDDLESALKHYQWFAEKYSDSSDKPLHTLCWALALKRDNKPTEAIYRLRRAHIVNAYMIPRLLKVPHGQPNIPRFMSWEKEDAFLEEENQFFELWNESDLEWLRSVWESQPFRDLVREHIRLTQQLDIEPVGPIRKVLVDALGKLRERQPDTLRLKLVTEGSGAKL